MNTFISGDNTHGGFHLVGSRMGLILRFHDFSAANLKYGIKAVRRVYLLGKCIL